MASDNRSTELAVGPQRAVRIRAVRPPNVPAVEKRQVKPQTEPPTTPNAPGQRRTGHVTQASDALRTPRHVRTHRIRRRVSRNSRRAAWICLPALGARHRERG